MNNGPLTRILAVDVYVVGQQVPEPNANPGFGATATYIATRSFPLTPGLVDFRTGNINLDAIPLLGRGDQRFSMEFDITFTLKPSIFDLDGNPVEAVWATPIEQGIKLRNPEKKVPETMTPKYLSSLRINVHNQNAYRDKSAPLRTFAYALGVCLPDYDNYFISLDPSV